jgi:DNA repair protein RecO
MSLGIVLKTSPSFEHHALVELFTKEYGRIRCFAKYAQTKKNRFGGQLNTLNLISAHCYTKGSGFNISNIRVLDSFAKIKTSYLKINIAFQFLHVVRGITQLNTENADIFDALVLYLTTLNDNDALCLNTHRHQFFKGVLKIEGVLDYEKNPNEIECISMLESYTNIKLKDAL